MRILFTKRQEIEIETENVREVVAAMNTVGWEAGAVNDKEVIGSCEVCAALIFEGDPHTQDNDGVYLCMACME